MQAHISWNYTTWLNIAALLLVAVLTVRFVRTDGLAMLATMDADPSAHSAHSVHLGHEHSGHEHGGAKPHRLDGEGPQSRAPS